MSALSAAAVIAAAVWGYIYFRNYDERMVRELVSELETMVSKRSGKSNALSLLDAATPERVFGSKVKIISYLPKMERDFTLKELSQMMLTVKKSCRTAKLDIEINSINIQGATALVRGNGMFSGESSANSTFREVRDVVFECKKIEGKWKIASVKADTVIKR